MLNVNAISNLTDSSFNISSGLNYMLAFNAFLTVKLNAYLGEKNREYTVEGNAISAEVAMNVTF